MNELEPSAPPTEPVGVLAAPLRAAWPTLLGVLSIAFGIIGIGMGVMGSLSPLIMGLLESIPNSGQEETVKVMRKWMWWTIASGAISTLIAALLLAAGMGLAMRRPWGVRLQKVWAVMKLLWIPVAIGGTTMMQLEQAKATQIQMSKQAVTAQVGAMMESFTMVMMGVTFLWLLVLPVVSLLWLRTGKAKAEISGWEPRRAEGAPPPA